VNLGLTSDQEAVRELFASLFAKESSTERVRAAEPLGFDADLWAHLTQTGAFGIALPEEVGGGGAGLLELALVAEEVGRRLAPVPFAESTAAVRLLAAAGAGDLLRQALDGSSVVSMATSAGPVDGQLLVDGAVADIVVGLDGEALVAVGRPTDVVHQPNLGSMPLARWRASSVLEVLDRGERALRSFAVALDEVRVLRAAALVGLAAEAISIGATYARDRQAFGIPIGTYQAVAHPLADALVAADGAQLLVWKACWAHDTGTKSAPKLSAMAFAFAAEAAFAAAQHSLHIHGGYGFTEEYDIQLYYRRAKAWATAFTDPRRELLVVADRSLAEAGG
jgi:alkylation response protein AidB-like acyl-CoA dehydrogenase